jgi:hypothetical protein
MDPFLVLNATPKATATASASGTRRGVTKATSVRVNRNDDTWSGEGPAVTPEPSRAKASLSLVWSAGNWPDRPGELPCSAECVFACLAFVTGNGAYTLRRGRSHETRARAIRMLRAYSSSLKSSKECGLRSWTNPVAVRSGRRLVGREHAHERTNQPPPPTQQPTRSLSPTTTNQLNDRGSPQGPSADLW